MNVLGAKKLAEVAAFIQLGSDIVERAGTEFAMSAPHVHSIFLLVGAAELAQVVPTDKAELFNAKRKKTIKKLTDMMELYIGDSWDNPIEVLEWSSFYAGAATAHCAVAASPAADMHKAGVDMLHALQLQFQALLDQVIAQLSELPASVDG